MILFKQKQSNKSSEFKKGEVLFLKKAREMIHQAERGKHRAAMPRSQASCTYRKISIRKYDHRLWHVKKNTATQSWTTGHRIFLQTCLSLFFFFLSSWRKEFWSNFFKCIFLRSQTPFIPFILWKSAKDPGFLQISAPFLISCIK